MDPRYFDQCTAVLCIVLRDRQDFVQAFVGLPLVLFERLPVRFRVVAQELDFIVSASSRSSMVTI